MATAASKSLPDIVQRELANAQASGSASVGILDELAMHGFSENELFELIVPRRTLARRRQAGGKLSPDESDRAVRLARLTEMAERIFGDEQKAHRLAAQAEPYPGWSGPARN